MSKSIHRCLLTILPQVLILVGWAQPPNIRNTRITVTLEDVAADVTDPTFQSYGSRLSVPARVVVEFTVPDTAEPERTIQIPVLMRDRVGAASTLKVTVAGKPVELEREQLNRRPLQQWSLRDENPRAPWGQRLNSWINKDQQLAELVDEYRRLAGDQQRLSKVTEQFDQAVRRHLIDLDMALPARYVASGDPYFAHLGKFISEIDPSLRINEPFQRWPYIPLISRYDPDMYSAYEGEWRKKADAWFEEHIPAESRALRTVWTQWRQSQRLLNGPITSYVHDELGLDLETALLFRTFLQSRATWPPQKLVAAVFPDIRRELQEQELTAKARLKRWGFDESRISPFSGRLNPATEAVSWNDWKDSSVRHLLNLPPPERAVEASRTEPGGVPSLLTIPRPETGSDRVQISYDVQIAFLTGPMASMRSFAQEELVVVLPAEEETPVDIRVPPDLQPVVWPEPQAVEVLDSGQRLYQCELNGDHRTLHLVPVQVVDRGHPYTNWFHHEQSDGLIEQLIDQTSNRGLKPLLRMAQLDILFRQNPEAAHRLLLKTRREHPEFLPVLDRALGRSQHDVKQAKEQFEFMERLASRPLIETDDDFHRFVAQSGNDSYTLRSESLQRLASRIDRLDPMKLKVRERLGRLFILCQAERELTQNLTALKLAAENSEYVDYTLRLIEHLQCPKDALLPYVLNILESLEPGGEKRLAAKDRETRYLAARTLRTFRSAETAPLILAMISKTKDAVVIQEAMGALSEVSIPEHFELIVEQADRVASSSGSAFMQYVDLLVRSDRERSIPVLERLYQTAPAHRYYIARGLGRAGASDSVRDAILAYNAADTSKEILSASISVLYQRATPKQIGELRYRVGLERWMNERLVSVIRQRGGHDSAWKFVKSYYDEFVDGNEAHNHLTCVEAFVRLGNPAAIPLLRKIVAVTERKRDAAQAIGRLMHPKRRLRRYGEDPFVEAIREIVDRHPGEENAEAWALLLNDPERGFERLLQYGPVRDAILNASGKEVPPETIALVKPFGPTAAQPLLDQSNGCSLEQRYVIARLLSELADAKDIIRHAVEQPNGDSDQLKTAELALKLADSR